VHLASYVAAVFFTRQDHREGEKKKENGGWRECRKSKAEHYVKSKIMEGDKFEDAHMWFFVLCAAFVLYFCSWY
jgi:hypothetical protein